MLSKKAGVNRRSEAVTWRSKLERGSNTELVIGRLCVSCAGGS